MQSVAKKYCFFVFISFRFEPCNYASNIAYYHTATEICAKQDWSMPQKYGKFFFTYLATFICRMGKFSRKHTEWQNSKYLHIYYFEFSRSRFPRYYIFFQLMLWESLLAS